MEQDKTDILNSIDKQEYIRLILQALQDLGFKETAAHLSNESKVNLQTPGISSFCDAVFAGNWELVISLLPELHIHNEDDLKKAKFFIYKQIYLELLEQKKILEALDCLRNQLAPLNTESELLHKLSSMLICKTTEQLRSRANWDGIGKKSRSELLATLRRFVSSNKLLPEKRLETLLFQAMEQQRSNCLYHNTRDTSFSLFEDHSCGRDQIPTETKQILQKHSDEVWYVEFSHNGKYLASASKDKTAIIWNLSENPISILHVLGEHTMPVSALSWSPDDKFVVTIALDKKIKLWDVATGSVLHSYTARDSVTSLAWMPDSKRFVTGGNDKQIHLWDTEGNLVRVWRWPMSQIRDLAVSGNGELMVVVAQGEKIHLFNVKDESKDFIVENVGNIISVALSEDGKWLLVNISMTSGGILTDQEIHLWNVNEKSLVNKYKGYKVGKYVIRSCFGGSNMVFVASGSDDGNVYIWQRNHGTLLEMLQGHKGPVSAVCWNPKNPYQFASAGDDGTVRVWESVHSSEPSLVENGKSKKRSSDELEEKTEAEEGKTEEDGETGSEGSSSAT